MVSGGIWEEAWKEYVNERCGWWGVRVRDLQDLPLGPTGGCTVVGRATGGEASFTHMEFEERVAPPC